jgi:hypothetical protein
MLRYLGLNSANLNRTSAEIRRHWKKNLLFKVSDFDHRKDRWSNRDSSKLIYVLFMCNFDNESDIDWDYIKEKFYEKSFNNVMKNWRLLKATMRDFQRLSYKQSINFLYENVLPNYIKSDEDLKILQDFYKD